MIRLAVRCAPDNAEPVLAELLALAPSGVEEVAGEGWVEFAIYGAEGELPDLGELEAVVDGRPIEVSSTVVADDWAERWREFHRAVVIGGRLRVRPPWEPEGAPAGPGAFELVIDPGRAFGTGAHPTTRLCLELMLALSDRGLATGRLTDLGTGSAVLAIAGARLGWDPVIALDHDPAALEDAARNAEANGVTLELGRHDVRDSLPPDLAGVVVANLTGPLLRALAGQLETGAGPSHLVCSGFPEPEAAGISTAFAGAGLAEVDRRTEGDWTALLLRA